MPEEDIHDSIKKLQQDLADLRARVAKLEAERAEAAAESLESSF